MEMVTNSRDRDEAIEKILKDKIVSLDFSDFILGNLIGWGCSRYVFENRFNNNQVIKVDLSSWNANVLEFNVWEHVSEIPRISKWFAPVIRMSSCGRILIQKKVNTKKFINEYSDRIPEFFTDIKQENFGFIGKQLVCFDYASNLLIEKGMSLKMKKVKWL